MWLSSVPVGTDLAPLEGQLEPRRAKRVLKLALFVVEALETLHQPLELPEDLHPRLPFHQRAVGALASTCAHLLRATGSA